jgi:hypothetical protein
MGEEEEMIAGSVVRIVRISRSLAPYPERPQIADFQLSSEDHKEAEAMGRPARLSVFDRERTTVDQCLQIRGLVRGEGREPVGFQLLVTKIREISCQGLPALRVFRDPLPSREPGADGHCGIAGLDRRPGESRAAYRYIISKLVDIASRVYSESSPPLG